MRAFPSHVTTAVATRGKRGKTRTRHRLSVADLPCSDRATSAILRGSAVALFALVFIVASSGVIDVGGAWHRSVDDRPAYATESFDDSVWATTSIPAAIGPPAAIDAPVIWYRRSIDAPPPGSLAIGVGVMPSAYEVYIDGERVGANGEVDGRVEGKLAPRSFPFPPHALDDGHAVVALRVWMDPDFARAAPLAKRASGGPWIVGDANLVGAQTELAGARLEASRGWELFLAFAFFGVALYHLFLWALRRDLYAWLAYSFTVLLLASWALLLAVDGGSAMLSWKLGPCLGALAGVPFIELVFRLLDDKPPPRAFRIAQAVLAPSALACLLPGRVGFLVAGAPLRILVFLGAMSAALAVVGLRAWRGNKDARILIGGFGVTAALVGYQVLSMASIVPAVEVRLESLGFLALVMAMAAALARRFTATMSDLDATNLAIERFVPYAFLNLLQKLSVRDVVRGDSVKLEMSVMFCDIRGFTTLAEAVGADATFKQVNRYLSVMEPEIHDKGGYINQYMGDGIMSLFHHGPQGAVEAAVGMARALERLNIERDERGEAPLHVGIGIHTGDLMLGTIGGGTQLDAGVIGDAANLASRVEGMTKTYGAFCIVSDPTRRGLTDASPLLLRELDSVVAKGRKEAVAIFEVLACEAVASRDKKVAALPAYAAALALYRAGSFAEAGRAFDAIVSDNPDDRAAAIFVDRCRDLASEPPEGWTGVTVLQSK